MAPAEEDRFTLRIGLIVGHDLGCDISAAGLLEGGGGVGGGSTKTGDSRLFDSAGSARRSCGSIFEKRSEKGTGLLLLLILLLLLLKVGIVIRINILWRFNLLPLLTCLGLLRLMLS